MVQKMWVISLGGSRIIPEQVDTKFIETFREIIEKHPSKKFIVVTGGGRTARNYISALKKMHKSIKNQSLTGIAITRLHASFLARLFGRRANEEIPLNIKKVEGLLRKNQVVFCGALRWKEKNTSDGTSASLAAHFKCDFINITNVRGLYDSNPLTNKNAKFIARESWKKFYERTEKIKFKAGQHFVLDQSAAKKIFDKKITTYIIGNLQDLDKIISNKGKISGSIITG